MGYTTDFNGEFKLDKPLTPEHEAYLIAFAHSRHMERNATITGTMPDPVREAAGLPLGDQAQYFVGASEINMGQDETSDVLDANRPPNGVPSLWCQWIPEVRYVQGEDQKGKPADCIAWDGGEKFYEYIDWIKYIIVHFLDTWGYVVDGEVKWVGEDSNDLGKIVIKNSIVTVKHGTVTYD